MHLYNLLFSWSVKTFTISYPVIRAQEIHHRRGRLWGNQKVFKLKKLIVKVGEKFFILHLLFGKSNANWNLEYTLTFGYVKSETKNNLSSSRSGNIFGSHFFIDFNLPVEKIWDRNWKSTTQSLMKSERQSLNKGWGIGPNAEPTFRNWWTFR